MDRKDLLELIAAYARRHPREHETVERIRTLVTQYENCFDRDCLPGHVTASAWIVSADTGHALLTHHRKLDRWLQLGGHTDGEADVVRAARREAEEESGLEGFVVLPRDRPPVILDVDVHLIPARHDEPAHEHHDVRFLLEVSEGAQTIRPQVAESKAMRWFSPPEVTEMFDEESLLRMARKAAVWLASDPIGPPRG